ncbi:unnamed protein product [Hymenolepis diminuta]|uniref:Uncharacterized protein n=1 Tax=Hymenolepis diminuta TaxID=6216 RepID=A0A564Y356_HYMDI|nr:unnamed protein product [Hymenolepis diminuta]
MSTLQFGGQNEFKYVRQSSSRFIIKRVFSKPATHIFHIPSNYPGDLPTWQFVQGKSRLLKPKNSFPDTDTTLARLFLRVTFLDCHINKRPFPDCFKGIDPIFYLYLQSQYESKTK